MDNAHVGRRDYDRDFMERFGALENRVTNLENALKKLDKLDDIDRKLDRYGWFGAGVSFVVMMIWGIITWFREQVIHLIK